MQSTLRKIKRVQPIIRLKKTKMDEEAVTLSAIRQEKARIVQSMKDRQRQYMEGVEQLNQVRASAMRDNLDTLEDALNYVKSQWYQLYKEVQAVERREAQQLQQLIVAERELRSVESLKERYEESLRLQSRKLDQKMMDEAALRRFSQRHDGHG